MNTSAWENDPTGRHQYRWWDGEQWTDQVADDGVQKVDPLSHSEAKLPRTGHQHPPSAPSLTHGPPGGELSAGSSSVPPDPLSMLASRWRRVSAELIVIVIEVTLSLLLEILSVIPILIWSLIVFSRGQSPGKQLLKMRVVRLDNHRSATWGLMALRHLVLKMEVVFVLNFIEMSDDYEELSSTDIAVFAILVFLSLWALANFIVFLSTENKQAIWDKMLNTVVISDPDGIFDPRRR
ncbi:RDD family protein [Candidatus Poriferisocius sp.]|uniref:RDD family protein n=1 Tax=Candidatus Poriferisocius sp. TaxID=3101276 RepID=UPI003B027CC6